MRKKKASNPKSPAFLLGLYFFRKEDKLAEVNLNLPGNSMFSQNQDQNGEKLKPVVDKSAIVSTKTPLEKRLSNAFLGFGDDIIDNVIIPGIKNLILQALEEKFFHTHGITRYGPYNYNQPYTSYNQPYNYNQPNGYGYNYNVQNNIVNEPNQMYPNNTQVDYRNIILRTKQDAESVVIQLRGRIAEFGKASVADLFDLIQIPGLGYTDNNWGWTNPNLIGIRRVSQGFLIVVPDAQPIGI